MDPYIPAPHRDATPQTVALDELCALYEARIRARDEMACDGSAVFAACVMTTSMFVTFLVTLILFADTDTTWSPWFTLALTLLQSFASVIMWSRINLGRLMLKTEKGGDDD